MPIVRRSRRLSSQTIPDPLEQCAPGGFDYLDIPYPATEPLTEYPIATTVTYDPLPSPQTIEYLTAFADGRELPPLDLDSQCRGRKGKNGNAPRPPNAFMLFRSDFWRFNKETIPERDHRQISRIAANCWNDLEKPRKFPYQERARQLKDEHTQLYPQHKYNLSAKVKVPKKVKKEEVDNDDLCGVVAAQVVQNVRAPKLPKSPGFSEGGLLDQVIGRKVNLKRPRSASAVATVEKDSKGESQPSRPPAKKRKRNLRKSSIAVIPVLVVQPQVDPSNSSTPLFVPTNEASALTLPPSRGSPVVEAELLQDPVLEIVAYVAAVENGPILSPPPMVASPKTQFPEFEVPEPPASVSPHLFPFDYDYPAEYKPEDTMLKAVKISEGYGLSRPAEESDYNSIDPIDNPPGTGLWGDSFDPFQFVNDLDL